MFFFIWFNVFQFVGFFMDYFAFLGGFYWDFLIVMFDFFFLFFLYIYFFFISWIILKVSMVTTKSYWGYYWITKIIKNSRKSFFCTKDKKSPGKRPKPSAGALKKSLRSGLYLLVVFNPVAKMYTPWIKLVSIWIFKRINCQRVDFNSSKKASWCTKCNT